MPQTLIPVDVKQPAGNQPVPLHNRWHPDIPAVKTVKQGDIFRVECLDCLGGQIQDNDSVDDIQNLNLAVAHCLSGPIAVEGVEENDFLVVDILDIGALRDSEWGFTAIIPKESGGGFLTDYFPKASKAIWNFEGIYAKSRNIPGVRIAGIMHPGVIGCAPSQKLLDEWNSRETELVNTDKDRVPPLACLPLPEHALLGAVAPEDRERVGKEAARTIPPREHGGNCDIKNLSKGSRLYLPAYIKGGNLSMGDIHFSQGDGEITFCGAIEMAGWLDIKVGVIKKGMILYKAVNPIFFPGPVEPRYTNFIVFEGISVENGKQYYLDATVAFRRACLNAVAYLQQFGYTGEQAYLLLSAAPCEGRVSGIVDIPNACCTLALPTDIFEFDIRPKPDGPTKNSLLELK